MACINVAATLKLAAALASLRSDVYKITITLLWMQVARATSIGPHYFHIYCSGDPRTYQLQPIPCVPTQAPNLFNLPELSDTHCLSASHADLQSATLLDDPPLFPHG